MKNNATIIGIAGVARAGKDTFANLAKNSLAFRGKKIRTVAFADGLKENAGKFLKEFCEIDDISKLSGQAKADVRPFLVWYGCYMRKKDPSFWVKQALDKIKKDDDSDVFLVTDVRFENEADWVHSFGGKIVHISRYQADPFQTSLVPPANEEEASNDPLVVKKSDNRISWPTVTDEHVGVLQKYVDEVL